LDGKTRGAKPSVLSEADMLAISNFPRTTHLSSFGSPENTFPERRRVDVRTTEKIRVINFILELYYFLPKSVVT